MEDLNFLTDLISNRVRTISFGVLAFCWLFILQNTSGQSLIASNKQLMIPVSLAILSLIADLAQYWFGYYSTRLLLSQSEKVKRDDLSYDYHSFSYLMRTAMFFAKQFLMGVATIWLLVILGLKVLG
ncbi:MAG: hypothetical protein IH977_01335 [Nitrospinae bacterium]|nr:hypothetical protein [Nitrospinota bacterium]